MRAMLDWDKNGMAGTSARYLQGSSSFVYISHSCTDEKIDSDALASCHIHSLKNDGYAQEHQSYI